MKKLLFMLTFLVSMLNPSVGWATTFIKEVAVSCNGKDPLKNNGYIVIDVDLNDGAGGRYIYAGYKTTTDASEAITDLIIRKGSEPDNHQFTWNKTGKLYKLATNPDGDNGNLNRGTGDKTPNYWLYYSKTGNTTDGESLVTSFYGHNGKSSSTEYLVGVSSANDDNPSGSQDLNQGAGGSYVYLGQKKGHTHRFSYWDHTTNSHQYGCASCGYVKSTTAHNWSNSGAKFQDQTCTTAEVHYQTCTTCGRTNDANHTYIAGNALGHSFDEVNDPHHTNCTRCKHTFFRYQSKDGNVVKPYSNNFGEAQILSNTYTNGEGVIEFDRTLTTIGDYAFYNCSGFNGDLVIPNSVTSIGNSAFYYCSGFKGKLVIPNSVTSIGNSAFYYCSGFTGDLVIPNSVTSIGEYAFYNCSGFNGKLVIPNSVTSIGISAFRDCSGFTGDLVIPNSVTSIGHYAFDNCSGFTGKLEIPNSVISIGNNAFDNCSGFTGDLVIPNSVTSIESYAFYKCSGFTGDLVIPNSVTSIGHQAFEYCSGFTGKLEIPNSVTNIGISAFLECSGFTGDLVIPNTVTSIRDYAFEGCTGLMNVLFLGNKPMLMGKDVFSDDSLTLYVKDLSKWNTNEKYGAKSLTYKTWKEYCEEVIGHHDLDENCLCSFCNNKVHTFAAEDTHHDFCTQCKHGFFRYQSKDGNVVDPKRDNFGEAQKVSNTYTNGKGVIEFDRMLTTIGDYAFYDRSGLTGDLVIPNTVTSIGYQAFYKCSGFTGKLEIPNSVTSIGYQAFYYCTGLTGDLVIPNSVTSIGNYAFYNCSGLTGKLVIPNSVTSIGGYAFRDCSGLTGKLVIPNSVTKIDYDAFEGCSGLKNVLFLGNKPETMRTSVFSDDSLTLFVKDLSQWNTNEKYSANSLTYKTWKEYCEEVIGEHDLGEHCTCQFCGNKVHTFADDDTHHTNCTHCEHTFFRYHSRDGKEVEPHNSDFGEAQIVSNTYADGEGVIEFDRKLTTIGEFAFGYCFNFTGDLVIPNSVTNIGEYAFYECSYFNGKLVIPNSVTSIGTAAFYNCSGFTGKLEIPNSVTSIGEYAFFFCFGFNGKLEIPNSVTTIKESAFENCYGFTSDLVIPNSVTTIGDYAFVSCSGFTGDLVIPNSVTTIGYSAFEGCSGFTGDLVIPNSVTSIGEGAFAGCKGFTGDLVIPNSVTSIENITFVGCESLTSVVIPNSVTSIGDGAFADCYSLQSVEIASLPLFGGDAFYGVPCGISIALTDESYVCGEKEFDDSELPSLQSASYTRQMSNEWGTLVLPFGIDYLPENGNYRLYRLERVENQNLLLSEYAKGNISAGTPVVVKAVGEKDSKGKYTLSIKQNAPTFNVKTETVECDNNGWCMKGTLEPMTAAAGAPFDPAGMNVYYIAQNQFWYANQAFDMARFRAWFEAPEGAEEASAMRFQIMEIEETGIHTCAAALNAESSFDLQGRRMSAPVKGLQIINGRKVLKK